MKSPGAPGKKILNLQTYLVGPISERECSLLFNVYVFCLSHFAGKAGVLPLELSHSSWNPDCKRPAKHSASCGQPVASSLKQLGVQLSKLDTLLGKLVFSPHHHGQM